jgi:translation elongation factor EF-4
VDSTQGIQAQTLANANLAIANNITLFPVITKVDLATSDPYSAINEIEAMVGLDCSHAVLTSAKTGKGIHDVLEGIVKYLPSPKIHNGIHHTIINYLVLTYYYVSLCHHE